MIDNQNNVEIFAQIKKASYLCCIRRTSFETWSLLSHTIILLQRFLLLIQDQPLPFLNSPLQTPNTLHFLRLSSRKSLSLRPCIMIICN